MCSAVRAEMLREIYEALCACGHALCRALQPSRAADAAATTTAGWEVAECPLCYSHMASRGRIRARGTLNANRDVYRARDFMLREPQGWRCALPWVEDRCVPPVQQAYGLPDKSRRLVLNERESIRMWTLHGLSVPDL